jgi:hypothetical protein
MRDHDPRPALRLVAAERRPTAFGDPRVLHDFIQICEAVSIVDPETGLILTAWAGQPPPSS